MDLMKKPTRWKWYLNYVCVLRGHLPGLLGLQPSVCVDEKKKTDFNLHHWVDE